MLAYLFMTDDVFHERTTVLNALTPHEWSRLWAEAGPADMIRVVRILDDNTRHVVLSVMPDSLYEPTVPDALTVAEIDEALVRVCAIAKKVAD